MKLTKNIIAFKSNAYILYRAIRDPRVAWYIKCLTLMLLAYIISPIDLVPDFIPVLGLLDEAILVPVALALIVRLIPEEVIIDYRDGAKDGQDIGLRVLGVSIILALWLLVLWLISLLWLGSA